MSWISSFVGRFSGDYHWPALGDYRGWIKTRDACATATEPRKNCVSYAYTQRNGRLEGLLSQPASQTAAATDQPKTSASRRLTLAPGQPPSVQQGLVVGYESAAYTVSCRKGQTLAVMLKSPSMSLYFNVLPIGSQEAIYASDRDPREIRER